MDLKLTGRSVLITGASKGIGLGIAKWFASEGVNACLVARSGDLLAKEAEGIRKSAQVNVQTMVADLSDPAARRKVFEAFPDVDIVVNNAGAIPGERSRTWMKKPGVPAGTSRSMRLCRFHATLPGTHEGTPARRDHQYHWRRR